MGQPEAYIDATKADLTPEGTVNAGAAEVLTGWLGAFQDFVEANRA